MTVVARIDTKVSCSCTLCMDTLRKDQTPPHRGVVETVLEMTHPLPIVLEPIRVHEPRERADGASCTTNATTYSMSPIRWANDERPKRSWPSRVPVWR